MNKCKSCGGRGRINAGYGSEGDMYHDCPDCDKQKPSYGGEFERVARNEEWYNDGRIVGKDQDMGIGTVISVQQAQFIVDAHSWTISELSRAHNADRVADKQRIAELEGEAERLKTPSGESKNRIFEIPDPNIHELFSGERWNVGVSITTGNANSTLAYLESEVTQRIAARENELNQRIAELEAQVPKVVTSENGKCPNCGGWCGWNYCQFCGSKLDNRGKK